MVQGGRFALDNEFVSFVVARMSQFDVRRFVDKCEEALEATDFHKVLARLAFLMDLYICDCDKVRREFADAVGVLQADYESLSTERRAAIKHIAVDYCLPTQDRLCFWMWRAWLLQQDFDGMSEAETEALIEREELRSVKHESDGEQKPSDLRQQGEQGSQKQRPVRLASPQLVRCADEWGDLAPRLLSERDAILAYLRDVPAGLDRLAEHTMRASWAMETFGGSPHATTRASRIIVERAFDAAGRLQRVRKRCGEGQRIRNAPLVKARRCLASVLKRLRRLERDLASAYGFAGGHRVNLRFDRLTRREIRAWYDWKHRSREMDFGAEFVIEDGGTPTQRTRNAAIKAASRFDRTLERWDEVLGRAEAAGEDAALVYARRIEREHW